jgi:hypothetical protein
MCLVSGHLGGLLEQLLLTAVRGGLGDQQLSPQQFRVVWAGFLRGVYGQFQVHRRYLGAIVLRAVGPLVQCGTALLPRNEGDEGRVPQDR